MEKRKVLIIEDEKSIRTMYAEILTDEGFEVLEEGDGMSGLNRALDGDWDVLLLDIMLPRLDGVELLKKLKNNPGTSSKPIIILSNLADPSIKKNCINLGAKEFLIKSDIVPSDVIIAIKKYVFTPGAKDSLSG